MSLNFGGQHFKFLLIKPKLELLTRLEMCLLKLRILSNSTPRYFALGTSLRQCCQLYKKFAEDFYLYLNQKYLYLNLLFQVLLFISIVYLSQGLGGIIPQVLPVLSGMLFCCWSSVFSVWRCIDFRCVVEIDRLDLLVLV